MRIGILGAGGIAHKMAATITQMENADLYAIGSRSPEKAARFAETFQIPRAYGSYEALVQDSSLDLIYIATPHSRHYEDCMLCLTHGKHVLCEKPFTANAAQAKAVIRCAEKRHLFLAEAVWTRFMPMRFTLEQIIASGAVGTITSLTANLGYDLRHVARLQKPELAGGALLDLGIYTIHFARMVFGAAVTDVQSSCVKNTYGVDMTNGMLLTFADGKIAVLHSSAIANTDRMGILYGSKGRIEYQNINNCEGIRVIRDTGEITEYAAPPQISGYEYEVDASLQAIREGRTETSCIPQEETIQVLELMDSLRDTWGIRYPFE